MINYIIISPVRNEEQHISRTIQSVLNQTIKPLEWIIVNDGSIDNTSLILQKYTEKYKWIKVVDVEDRGYYLPGTGVIQAVTKGYNKISNNNWDYLVKLDCDITLDEDYFESLLYKFENNPSLGIASGGVYLKTENKLIREKSQFDHPWGASKIYRKACFNDIGGLKPIPGWDLADLLSAQMKGWETRCFDEYKIIHYRMSGSRRTGFTGGKFLLGRFLYRYGYNFGYTIMKGIFRLLEPPYIIGGLSLIFGYIYAFIKHEDKLFDKEMRKFLRKKQHKYLQIRIKSIFQI